MAEPSLRIQIQALIDIKERRTLQGEAAIFAWLTEAVLALLKAEVERQERADRIAASLGEKK